MSLKPTIILALLVTCLCSACTRTSQYPVVVTLTQSDDGSVSTGITGGTVVTSQLSKRSVHVFPGTTTSLSDVIDGRSYNGIGAEGDGEKLTVLAASLDAPQTIEVRIDSTVPFTLITKFAGSTVALKQEVSPGQRTLTLSPDQQQSSNRDDE